MHDTDDAADFLYPPEVLRHAKETANRAFLSPLNKFVDEFNEKMLERLPGECGSRSFPLCKLEWRKAIYL